MSKLVQFIFLIFAMSLLPNRSFASKELNAKDVLFEHIGDHYEWEIFSHRTTTISIPLPVLVISKNSGVHVFSSSKLRNGQSHLGFSIAKEGKDAKKIVETDAQGKDTRPLDLSITKNVSSLLLSSLLILWVFLGLARKYTKAPFQKPSGIQAWIEPLILFMQEEVIIPSIPRDYARFAPYLQTAFFFIFLNNLLGMIPFFPGGANLTGNISITLVLALITYFTTTFNGNKHYWKEIFWPDVPLFLKFPIPILPVIEFFSTLTKPIALTVRLFANMLAGHLMVLVLVCLIFILANINVWAGAGTSIVAVSFSIFLSVLELLVAFIQAFVFTQLSALFIGLAVDKGHTESHN